MLPHKLHRGKVALDNLKVFDGVPSPYDKQKRMVVPSAMRVIRLKPRRKFCVLNRLSHEVGWKYQGVISTLENRRKVRSSLYHKKKVQEKKLMDKARTNVLAKAPQYQKIIESMGYN